MSGLDVAAAAIGIAGVGMNVAKGLFQISDTIGSAGEEVRMCACSTDLFSRMLVNLSTALKMPTVTGSAQSTADDLVDVCERILEPFKRLISKMTPLLEKYCESEHQLQQIGLRIQWCFRHKSKVLFYQQALSQLTAILTCLLDTISLQQSSARAPENVFIFQMQVENSKTEVERRARGNQAVLVQPASSKSLEHHLLPSTCHWNATETLVKEINEPTAGSASSDPINNDAEGNHVPDDDELDDGTDNDTALALYIDLLSLQHKISRFATGVLRFTTPSQSPPGHSSSKAANGTRWTQSQSSQIPSQDERPPLNQSSSAPSRNNPFSSADTSTPLNVFPPSAERKTSWIHVPKTPASGTSNPAEGQSIEITDSLGNVYEFPFGECRTVEGLLSLLRKIYGGHTDTSIPPSNEKSLFFDQKINSRTQRYYYPFKPCHLYRSGGGRILPELWEQLVRPGWKVHFEFEDPSLNRAIGLSSLDLIRRTLHRKLFR